MVEDAEEMNGAEGREIRKEQEHTEPLELAFGESLNMIAQGEIRAAITITHVQQVKICGKITG